MPSTMRAKLKRMLPSPARRALSSVRRLITAPPIDEVVLADYVVRAEDNAAPRLTIVLPRLASGSDFGGFATGIDIFARLCLALRESIALDVRVIITDVIAETDPPIVTSRCAKAGLVVTAEQIEWWLARAPPSVCGATKSS